MIPQLRQDARAQWRSKTSDWYDRYCDCLLLDRLFAPWEASIARRHGQVPTNSADPYCEGRLPADLGFIVATSSGLDFCRGSAVSRISAGRYFGVTIRGTRVYAFEQVGMHGQIVSFELSGPAARKTVHIRGFNRWIHQIDFIDNDLAVVDTLHNRILVYRDIEGRSPVHWSRYDREIAPAGRDRKGRLSPGHRQFNSIYRSGDKVRLVAHNESSKTGRPSEVWTFDSQWRLIDILTTAGHCCHNLVPHERGMLMNWSLQQSLRLGDSEVYRACGFNRGLAYDGQYVLVGISPLTRSFADRERAPGYVDVLDNDFQRIGRVVFPSSSVRDLRISEGDHGLSNSARS